MQYGVGVNVAFGARVGALLLPLVLVFMLVQVLMKARSQNLGAR